MVCTVAIANTIYHSEPDLSATDMLNWGTVAREIRACIGEVYEDLCGQPLINNFALDSTSTHTKRFLQNRLSSIPRIGRRLSVKDFL